LLHAPAIASSSKYLSKKRNEPRYRGVKIDNARRFRTIRLRPKLNPREIWRVSCANFGNRQLILIALAISVLTGCNENPTTKGHQASNADPLTCDQIVLGLEDVDNSVSEQVQNAVVTNSQYAFAESCLLAKLREVCTEGGMVSADTAVISERDFIRIRNTGQTLSRMNSSGSIPILIDCSDRTRGPKHLSPDYFPALAPLLRFGDAAIPDLLETYQRANPPTRCRIGKIVRMMKSSKASDNLKKLLDGEKDPNVRRCFAKSNSNGEGAAADEDEEVLLDEVDRFAETAGVKSLRKKTLATDSREDRIWVGFGPGITRGLIFEKAAGRSKGIYLPPTGEESSKTRLQDLAPKDGWSKFWFELDSSGMLALPDDSAVGRLEPQPDSNVVLVEVRRGEEYRWFLYSAPCYSRAPEAQTLVTTLIGVGQTIGLDFYRCY